MMTRRRHRAIETTGRHVQVVERQHLFYQRYHLAEGFRPGTGRTT